MSVEFYPLAFLIALPIIVYSLRELLTAKIRESVRVEFEADLEKVRSELRKSEQAFRADLNAKESELTALREGALTGRAQRQAMISERRIDALDSIWQKFNRLATLKFGAQMYSRLNIEEIEKGAPKDPKIRQFVDTLTGHDPLETLKDVSATNEKIYVPDMVWAIYSAYSSILTTCYIHMKALGFGMENAGTLLKWDRVADLAKAVLPHQGGYIDKYGSSGLPHLLEEIEEKMVVEIRKAFVGAESDEETIKQSAEIMNKVAIVSSESKLGQEKAVAEMASAAGPAINAASKIDPA